MIKRTKRDIKFILNTVETKQLSTLLHHTVVSDDVNTTASLQVLNGIIPGNAFYQRIGSTISMQDLHIRMHLVWTLGRATINNNSSTNGYRTLVVLDKKPSNQSGQGVPTTTPIFSTIFQDHNASGTATTTWISDPNHEVGERFDILYDEVTTLVPIINPLEVPTFLTPSKSAIPIDEEIFVQLGGYNTKYNTAGELTEGALYLIVIANHNLSEILNGIDNYIQIRDQTARLTYRDA